MNDKQINKLAEKIRQLRVTNDFRMRFIQQVRQDLKYKQQQDDIEHAESVFNKSPQYKGQKI